MKRLVIILSALLLCLSLEGRKTICYVPLDNRPVSYERVIYLCNSMGFDILIPDKDMVATRLDHMGPLPDGRSCGDRKRIFEWLKSCEGECDWYVISLDQMLSGGLVSSRWMDNTDLEFEFEVCDYLKALSLKHKVILYDTVMRLASTAGYGGYGLKEYDQFRAYGKEERLELHGVNLTRGNIIKTYTVAPDGCEIDTKGLSKDQLDKYFACRERKLRLSERILEGESDFDWFYMGVDDCTPGNSIHTNEIRYLSGLMHGNGCLGAATDELGLTSLARIAVKEYGGVKVNLKFIGGKEKEYADSYNYLSLEEDAMFKTDFIGIEKVNDTDHLNILVLTRSDKYDKARAEMLQTVSNLLKEGKSVCVIDANSNMPGNDQRTQLGRELVCSDIPLMQLMGYSSWNTASNSLGIGMANSISRYAYLKRHRPSEKSNRAFLKGLAFSYLKDVSYKSCGFGESSLVSNEPCSFNYVLNKLNSSRFVTSIHPFRTRAHGTISVSDFSRPFDRTFEILFEVNIE